MARATESPFPGLLLLLKRLVSSEITSQYWEIRRCNTRGLAGKPFAGFCTTPSRRITVVYGVIVYAIRFKNL